MHRRDIPTLSVAEAAKLLTVHANTIRYRLTKGVYKHSKAVTPTGEVYMIDARDFYRQHPEVAPEGWSHGVLEGDTAFVGDSDAIEGGAGARAMEPLQEGATGALAFTPAMLRSIVHDEVQTAVSPLHEALRVSHEDSQMLRQQVTQLQQQQAVIYHEVRQQRGRGVLRRLMGL